jgi:hypothetical protein
MPVVDPVFAQSPAEKNRAVFPQRVKVDQAGLESLEDATDRFQFLQKLIDSAGVPSDFLTRRNQLLGLSPVGPGSACEQLESPDSSAPGRVFPGEVRDDSPHQRERAFGLFQCEQLEFRHGVLPPHNFYFRDLLGVTDETYDLSPLVDDRNGGSQVRFSGIEIHAHLETLQLSVGLHDRRVGPHE